MSTYEVALRHLDRFLTQRAAYVQELTRLLLDRMDGDSPADRAAITRRNYFRVAKQFCMFRARTNPATAFIPGAMGCPRVMTRFRPLHLLGAGKFALSWSRRQPSYLAGCVPIPMSRSCSSSTQPSTPHRRSRPPTTQVAMVLTMTRGVLRIQAGKFRKARLVPIRVSLLARLDEYLEHRQRTGAAPHPDAPRCLESAWTAVQLAVGSSGRHLPPAAARLVCGKRRWPSRSRPTRS